MKVTRQSLQFVLLPALIMTITACGGGGSGSGQTPSPNPDPANGVQSGTLSGFIIEGLDYSTATESGTTDNSGQYSFRSGETVTFSIGDLTIGTIQSGSDTTLFDFIDGAKPVTHRRVIISSLNLPTSPLISVINLAVFFNSMDADFALENGIQLPPDLANYLTDNNLSFDMPLQIFSLRLQALLVTMNEDNVFNDRRIQVKPHVAIHALYESLNLQSPRGLTSEMQFLTPQNLPELALSSTTYSFDSQGNETTVMTAPGGGIVGGPMLDIDRTFDSNSNILTSITDTGQQVNEEMYNYDSDGRLIRYENSGGFLLEREYSDSGWTDTIFQPVEAAGVSLLNSIGTFGPDGNALNTETDSNNDGVLDTLITYFYSGNRWPLLDRVEIDNGKDGTIDSITYTSRNEAGLATLIEVDNGADGSINESTSITLDSNGRITRLERDEDGDGMADSIQSTSYNEFGDQIEITSDLEANGVINFSSTLEYDGQRNAVRGVSMFTLSDGSVQSSTNIYSYDGDGNVIALERDSDSDEVTDQRGEFEYLEPNGWSQILIPFGLFSPGPRAGFVVLGGSGQSMVLLLLN